ncbi:hypothetical protein G9A89_016486 [Geosiphon pyriformis]|nr:hypothetical protein G9A89_016486 [Geosiphon pyriformis]
MSRHLVQMGDVNERCRVALAKIDNANIGWFHILACLIAGIWDFLLMHAINIVSAMIGYVYFAHENNVDYCWSLVLAIGAVTAMIALYFRLTIPESPRYVMNVEKNIEQATHNVDQVLNNSYNPGNTNYISAVEQIHGFKDFCDHFIFRVVRNNRDSEIELRRIRREVEVETKSLLAEILEPIYHKQIKRQH